MPMAKRLGAVKPLATRSVNSVEGDEFRDEFGCLWTLYRKPKKLKAASGQLGMGSGSGGRQLLRMKPLCYRCAESGLHKLGVRHEPGSGRPQCEWWCASCYVHYRSSERARMMVA